MKSRVDKRKGLRSNPRMKTKVSFKDILASVRKTGGRPSVAFTPKKVKHRNDRHAWKREQE